MNVRCKYTESGYHDWRKNLAGDVGCSRCYLPLYPLDCARERDELHAQVERLKATEKRSTDT